jgi:hypothetical protein
VLQLIDKGIPAEDVREVVQNLSRAGVAVVQDAIDLD